jgi:imidazolonepropionase
VVVSDGVVAWVGAATQAPAADQRVDVGGRAVLPGFVDSHAHLVFAGDRAAEFEARMSGVPYDGGGIASTVAATREASDDELRARLAALVAEMRAQGTTTVEVKSGYGLSVEDEARALRLACEVTDETTFLGAHVVPAGSTVDAYVDLVTGSDARRVCALRAVDRRVLRAGIAARVRRRRGADRAAGGPRGGARAAGARQPAVPRAGCPAGCGAGRRERRPLHVPVGRRRRRAAGAATVATLLPGVEFSTRSPYPDARRLLAAGVTVALATDCNPGSCYTSSMPFCVALAVREMGMTPGRGGLVGDRRRRGGPATQRRGPSRRRRSGGPRGARRPVVPPSRLPPRRTPRHPL